MSDGEIPLAQLSKDSYYDALWLGEADTQFIKSRIWPMWTLPVGIKSKIVKGRIIMIKIILRRLCLVSIFVLAATQILAAQQKPRVFFSDDFFIESNPAAYLWFYDQKGILDKAHAVDGSFVEIVKAFAKNCECTVVREPDDADYVVIISRHDVEFRPKLAEKKFVVIKVDGEKLISKGSVRRASNIASDSCTAILKDSKQQ